MLGTVVVSACGASDAETLDIVVDEPAGTIRITSDGRCMDFVAATAVAPPSLASCGDEPEEGGADVLQRGGQGHSATASTRIQTTMWGLAREVDRDLCFEGDPVGTSVALPEAIAGYPAVWVVEFIDPGGPAVPEIHAC